MPNPTLSSLLNKIGNPGLIETLSEKLSLSELNSLLLEVMKRKASSTSPAELMKSYQKNRFVTPSLIDSLTFLKAETQLLELAKQNGFEPLELSPLAPLGNCSAIARADQNKIVSALRGTEVVADATNLMALEAASRRKASAFNDDIISLCTVHRHVRAQALPPVKGFTAHFKIFCAVTAGRDKGNLEFEKQALLSHLALYRSYLQQLGLNDFQIILKTFGESSTEQLAAERVADQVLAEMKGTNIVKTAVPKTEHHYYSSVRFSLNLNHRGKEFNLGDGGFVDWSQKLTSNNKERMFTSGLGIELLLKLVNGVI
jgi:hypothetical protein